MCSLIFNMFMFKVKGATSTSLKTYKNITYSSYRETALAMNLFEDDK